MPAGRQKAKAKSRTRAKPAAQPKPVVQPDCHKPVDYSRFENIQTSDEEDEHQQPRLHSEAYGAAGIHMPPHIQSLLPSKNESGTDDTDEDSYSSEDDAVWLPKETPQKPGSSAAGSSTVETKPAPVKPAAAKTAAMKATALQFGLKSGFLTGRKASGAASSRGKSSHKTEAGNGIKEVSDEDSDEDDIMEVGMTAGSSAASRAASGPTGVQPLPNGKYTRAELASFEDSNAPPSLHSSEEAVPRMHYSGMDFGAKPASRGTAAGSSAAGQKAAKAGSAAPAAGRSDDSRSPRVSQSSSAAARSAKPAGKTPSRPAPEAVVKYSPDQKRVAAAVMTMLKAARRNLHPAAEGALRVNFGLHHPDTKPFLAMIPMSGELPSLVTLLELASNSVLDALGKIAQLCSRSGMTALELFQKNCSFERMPDDVDMAEATMQVEPQSVRRVPVSNTTGDKSCDLVLSNEIRPDLALLMSFMRQRVAEEKVKRQQKYIDFFERVLPGIWELFRLKDTSVVPGSLLAQLNAVLKVHRDEAAKLGPYEHFFKVLITHSAGDLPADLNMEKFFELLTGTLPHLDKPTLFLEDEGQTKGPARATGQRSAQAKAKAADSTQDGGRPAGSMDSGVAPKTASCAASPADATAGEDFTQAAIEWVAKLGAEGDMREASAMAMVKMFEALDSTLDLVDCNGVSGTSKGKSSSKSDMNAFLEDLIPGAHDAMVYSAYKAGQNPGLGGLDLDTIAAHFHNLCQDYRTKSKRSKRPHNELLDSKLARSPRLAENRHVRRLVRAMEVASSPLVAACGGRLQHPACLLKMELPPQSLVATELRELADSAIYATIDKILSVFLESSNITRTSNRLKQILPGMEDMMRKEADAGLEPGWVMRCASHMVNLVPMFCKEALPRGETFEQHIHRRAAEAKALHEGKVLEELLSIMSSLPNSLYPAMLEEQVRRRQEREGSVKGLSARQQELLAMEGSSYFVRWVGGEPILVRDGRTRCDLSTEEEHFILQHAPDVKEGKQPRKAAAAAAPREPKAQAPSWKAAGGSKQGPGPRGAPGPTSKSARRSSTDNDADSLPDLMQDDDLADPTAAGPTWHNTKAPSNARPTTSTRAIPAESSASVDDEDTIKEVEDSSDGDMPDVRASGRDRPGGMSTSDYPAYDLPYPTYSQDYWPEPRLPKGVPQAEKTRLREKMMKRREEQDAKALQEKLAASQAQNKEAAKQEAERKAEEQRQRLAQKLIEEEDAAKKKAARQAEARQKKKAKKAKQRGLKQQKAPQKEASSDSEQGGEEEDASAPDSGGKEEEEHDLATFAGLRVSDSGASVQGMAKVKGQGKQASAKAQAKPASGGPQQPGRPKQPSPPSQERVNAEAVQRGVEEAMGAFGNVSRSAAPNAPQSSSRSAAQQHLLPPSKAPVIAPASEVLQELEAAMDSRDVDRLEEAIRKGDAWAKRAPINHVMTQVRQKLKQARELQRRQLPMGAARFHQAPRTDSKQSGASAFPAAVQALFQRPPSPGHIPSQVPQQQRQPMPPPVPVQAASPRTTPAPIPPHLQHVQTSYKAQHVRPYQPPVPAHTPAQSAAQQQPPSTAQRLPNPGRHGARVAEMSQEWKAATMSGALQGTEDYEDDELCVVCWDRPREVIFLSCGHMCACCECAADIMEEERRAFCPMCRAKIGSTMMAKF